MINKLLVIAMSLFLCAACAESHSPDDGDKDDLSDDDDDNTPSLPDDDYIDEDDDDGYPEDDDDDCGDCDPPPPLRDQLEEQCNRLCESTRDCDEDGQSCDRCFEAVAIAGCDSHLGDLLTCLESVDICSVIDDVCEDEANDWQDCSDRYCEDHDCPGWGDDEGGSGGEPVDP